MLLILSGHLAKQSRKELMKELHIHYLCLREQYTFVQDQSTARWNHLKQTVWLDSNTGMLDHNHSRITKKKIEKPNMA